MSKSKILVGITGSIAAYKSCELISLFIKSGHEVRVIASKNALKFIGEATLEGLTGQSILQDTFASGGMMEHIHTARWADQFIVAPASANFIAQLANGFANDLISTLSLAFEVSKKFYVAPAMNLEMWKNPATQENIKKIKSRGIQLLGPASGDLACGENGIGRMLEPFEIYQQTTRSIDTDRKHVLITSGGTRESIDGVRFLTNMSTGQTGARLAEELNSQGHTVTLLCSETSARPESTQIEQIEFSDFKSLETSMKTLLSEREFDIVVHAAAVSDFSVQAVYQDGKQLEMGRKIESRENLQIHLSPNEKILARLRGWSKNKSLKVVGFKLTHTDSHQEISNAVAKLFSQSAPDIIVQNDLSGLGKSRENHIFQIFTSNDSFQKHIRSTPELADHLGGLLL